MGCTGEPPPSVGMGLVAAEDGDGPGDVVEEPTATPVEWTRRMSGLTTPLLITWSRKGAPSPAMLPRAHTAWL